MFDSAGKVDVANRYSSTVMVSAEVGEELCSGVLLAPRLVLTAAHCMCPGRPPPSGCALHATVTLVLYEPGADKHEPDMQLQPTTGQVHLHPEFSLLLDGRGAAVSSHADLAVILLDEPVKARVAYASLPDAESQAHEALVMVGYGHDKHLGGRYGMRYFRRNEVTRNLADGRFLYEQQGAYVYNGFSGGPCLREKGQEQWLAGIASIGSGTELSFTSTYFYRDWLRTELERAQQPHPSPPPHAPE